MRLAHNLSRRARVNVLALRNAQADDDSRSAIALLDTLPRCVEQAQACGVQAQLRMLARDVEESAHRARRAIALADRFDDRETLAAAHGTLGAALLFVDWGQGVAEVEQALRIAQAAGLHWVAANNDVNLGSAAGELLRLTEAHRWLSEMAQIDQRMAQVVEMRYFGGLTDVEIAEALHVTERTVRRDWQQARLFLAEALK